MRSVTVILATTLALGCVELWTYLFGPGYEEQFLMPDPVLGWRLRPGAAGWTAEENTLWVRINSDGLRDREHSRERPPRTLRIAVLGDSYMQATNVAFEDSFPAQLEQRVGACLAPRGIAAEVINFGVSGYGTAQQLLTYRHHVSLYRPDVVLTAMYLGNDLHDNYRPFDAKPEAPYFVLDGDSLVEDTSFLAGLDAIERQPWRVRLRKAVTSRSRAAMLLYRPWTAIRPALWPEPDDDGTPRTDEDEDAAFLRPPGDDEDMIGAWTITEAILGQLAREVRAAGAEPWLVTLSVASQVHPEIARRAAVARALGVEDLYYAERRVMAFAGGNNISAVALAEPLAAYAARHRVFLNGGHNRRVPAGEGHWNATAHRIAADLVGSELCARTTIR